MPEQRLRAFLSLNSLSTELESALVSGEVCLANAYVLGRWYSKEREIQFLEEAKTRPPSDFVPYIYKFIKEEREEKRKSRSKKNCIMYIRREFYKDGKHDGGETECVYEDHPNATQLKEAKSLEEVKKIIGNEDYYYRVEITEVKVKSGVLK